MSFIKNIPEAERGNVLTHALGFFLSFIIFVAFIYQGMTNSPQTWITSSLYGGMMTTMFAISTCYHSQVEVKLKHRLRVADHIAIFLMIAITHTCTMLAMPNIEPNAYLLAVIWLGTLLGVLFKRELLHNRWDEQKEFVSIVLYLFLGFLGVLVVGTNSFLKFEFPIILLWVGGAGYLIGVVFYIIDCRSKECWWAHPTWHALVLFGAMSHAAAHAMVMWDSIG